MNTSARTTERGSARLKFIIVIAIIAAVVYAGYLYVPVAYQSYLFKDYMQRTVDTASALGHPTSWVSDQIAKSAAEYNVPANAVIVPSQQNNRMEVRVQFTRPIEFPGYTYQYDFDYTAKSTAFLTFK